MSTEQNKTLMRRFLSAVADSDQAVFRELLAEDVVAHLPQGNVDRNAYIIHNSVFANAFSDANIDIHDLIAEDNKVVARVTWSGNHTGDYRGIPPSGKRIEISAFIVERFRDGKSVEHWGLFDVMTMMQQLGLVPTR